MPTIDADTFAGWRREFVGKRRAAEQGAALAQLLRWGEEILPTNHLPANLQYPWNAELTRRVQQRLQDFFDSPRPETQAFSGELVDQGKRPDASEQPVADAEPAIDPEFEAASRRRDGDLLGAGEALTEYFGTADKNLFERLLAGAIASWASATGFVMSPTEISDLVAAADVFERRHLALALVHVCTRAKRATGSIPEVVSDLAFNLRDEITARFDLSGSRGGPLVLCSAAVERLEGKIRDLRAAVEVFTDQTCITAKQASIELVRRVRELASVSLPGELPVLQEVQLVLGPAFRKFCESCERFDNEGTVRRATELREQVTKLRERRALAVRTRVWVSFVAPVLDHVLDLLEEGTSRSLSQVQPELAIAANALKLDLSREGRHVTFATRLLNKGPGKALGVRVDVEPDFTQVELTVSDPPGPFDISAHSEQLITIRARLLGQVTDLMIPVRWVCQNSLLQVVEFSDTIRIAQQQAEPVTCPPKTGPRRMSLLPLREERPCVGISTASNRSSRS